MKYIFAAFLAISIGVKLPAQQNHTQENQDVPPTAVILRFGDLQVTRAEFERLAYAGAKPGPGPAEQQAPLPGLTDVLILAGEARRRGIDKEPGVAAQLDLRADQYLGYSLFQHILADVREDEAGTRKYFESRPPLYDSRDLRQLLVRFHGSQTALKPGQKDLTESEAKEKIERLRGRIAAGEDFAALAKTESDDVKTSSDGGRMLGVQHGMTVAAFEMAVFKAKSGELIGPVKTEFGYHLIRVEAIHAAEFETVRKTLEYEIAQQKLQDIVKQAQLNQAYFGKHQK